MYWPRLWTILYLSSLMIHEDVSLFLHLFIYLFTKTPKVNFYTLIFANYIPWELSHSVLHIFQSSMILLQSSIQMYSLPWHLPLNSPRTQLSSLRSFLTFTFCAIPRTLNIHCLGITATVRQCYYVNKSPITNMVSTQKSK